MLIALRHFWPKISGEEAHKVRDRRKSMSESELKGKDIFSVRNKELEASCLASGDRIKAWPEVIRWDSRKEHSDELLSKQELKDKRIREYIRDAVSAVIVDLKQSSPGLEHLGIDREEGSRIGFRGETTSFEIPLEEKSEGEKAAEAVWHHWTDIKGPTDSKLVPDEIKGEVPRSFADIHTKWDYLYGENPEAIAGLARLALEHQKEKSVKFEPLGHALIAQVFIDSYTRIKRVRAKSR